MKVGITGGTGVVGTAVVRHLVESGAQVVATARSATSERALEGLGATPVFGDVTNFAAMTAAFEGCEIVYHVGGVNEMCSRDPAHMYRVNVDGTRTVVRACQAAGVRRLVLTSSATAIGEPRGVLADEWTPHRGFYLSDYERSKHHAEQVALAEAGSLELVIVNPSSVQGPGRATGTGKLILQVLRGKLGLLVESEITLVDIDDCARGHMLAAEKGKPGERYLLSGHIVRVSEAVELAAEVLGRPIRPRLVPIQVAYGAAALVAVGSKVARRQPPLCPEMVRVIAHGHRHDGSRATRELGLDYRPLQETLERLISWFQSEGLLRV